MADGFIVPLACDVQWWALGAIAAAAIVPVVICHIATVWLLRRGKLDVMALGNPTSTTRKAERNPSPITILIPAFNERETIVQAVRAACASDYPGYLEIIAINDGSLDDTLDVLVQTFGLRATWIQSSAQCPCNEPMMFYHALVGSRELRVIDKRNGGKADALNSGINIARGTYICVIDADTLLAANAISRLWRVTGSSPNVVAVGGCVAVGNCASPESALRSDRRPLLVAMQRVEYLREFVVSRVLKIKLGLLVVIPGAFGLFRRDILVELEGYTRHTVGEDLEITVRIHRRLLERRRPYEIRYANGALAWTEAPDTLRGLACQRGRWARAALQTLFRHRDMVFGRCYGLIGFCGVGSLLIHNIVSPVLSLAAPVAMLGVGLSGAASWTSILAFWLLLTVARFMTEIHVFSTLRKMLPHYPDFAAGTERSILLLLFYAFAYRSLLLLFRTYGIWQQITRPQSWGKIPRRGFIDIYSGRPLHMNKR